MRLRRLLPLLPVLALMPPASGLRLGSVQQGSTVDAGAFTIVVNGTVIGREDFSLRRGRPGSADGFTLATTVQYPPGSARVTLAPVVELGPDSLPTAVQFDIFGNGQRRVYARFGPRRITVRIVRPDGEAAREYPSGHRYLVVDDSVFALYAVPPSQGPDGLYLIAPRQDRRVAARWVDRGMDRTLVGGVVHTLRHVVLETPDEARHLWYDAAGRLLKVALPSRDLTAERTEGIP